MSTRLRRAVPRARETAKHPKSSGLGEKRATAATRSLASATTLDRGVQQDLHGTTRSSVSSTRGVAIEGAYRIDNRSLRQTDVSWTPLTAADARPGGGPWKCQEVPESHNPGRKRAPLHCYFLSICPIISPVRYRWCRLRVQSAQTMASPVGTLRSIF